MKRYARIRWFIVPFVAILLVACSNRDTAVQAAETEEMTTVPAESVEPAANPETESETEPDEGDSQPSFETTEVTDGLYSFGNGEAFGAFLVTDEGVVVMDSINTNFAIQMLAAIREVTDQPIEWLIYSHNHWDHIAGGQVFKDAGATILGHRDIQEWLANHPEPNPAVLIPDETWDGARHDVVLGGKTIELYHFGPSHGEGMTVFRFPEENTIFTVDLVVPKRVGFAYMPDFTPRGWIATLNAIEKLEYETVMFAHHAAFGPRSAVTEQREFLEDLKAELLSMMERGENPFEVFGNPNAIELPKYQDWAGYDMWLGLNAQRILLEMIMGH